MIVVTGATGNVGRPLVLLLDQAGEQVTAASRRVTAADVPASARAVPADLASAPTFRPALEPWKNSRSARTSRRSSAALPAPSPIGPSATSPPSADRDRSFARS
jgi:NAD(P)-dependent dehydrogenase (short-subunit alcohol dehydrogenase family)